MKKPIFLLFAFIFSISALMAQQPNLQEPQKQIILKPVIKIEDLAFAYTTLNSVEIVGNEVESFLGCKNLLETAIKKAQTDKKAPGDSMVVDIPLLVGQNMIALLSRAKITGNQADQFKRFIDALVESGKKLNNK